MNDFPTGQGFDPHPEHGWQPSGPVPPLPNTLRVILALLILAAVAGWPGCASIGNVKLCATGEDFNGSGCVCKPGHVPDDDGKGCHLVDAPATTTTSTTTTTTTSTTPAPIPTTTTTTLPPIAPSPTPTCIPEPSMPSGPADVRNGFKPSSCEQPGTNNACWRSPFTHSNGNAIAPPASVTNRGQGPVPWEHDEGFCWPAWEVSRQWGESSKCLGGVCLACQAGYLSDADDTLRGCFDAYGRRYEWDGAAWREGKLAGFAWRWTNGICPPRTATTCAPTPAPTPRPDPVVGTCALPAMPECGGRQPDSDQTGVWGCCITDKAAGYPRATPYDDALEQVQDAIERERAVHFDVDGRVDEDEYVNEVVRRLLARGLCAKRSSNPSEEIGIKGSNTENYQYDLVLSNGRPRHHGYTAFCRPARF